MADVEVRVVVLSAVVADQCRIRLALMLQCVFVVAKFVAERWAIFTPPCGRHHVSSIRHCGGVRALGCPTEVFTGARCVVLVRALYVAVRAILYWGWSAVAEELKL